MINSESSKFVADDNILSASDLYQQFLDVWRGFRSKSWTLVLFEGSPEKGLYSWCPDCNVALIHLRNFREKNRNAKLLNFKVGSRKEWESDENPFRKDFPNLEDLPTLVLFFGRMDMMRIVAPREADFEFVASRARIYEEQIKSGDWNPPRRFQE
jgi:hypothetical protein